MHRSVEFREGTRVEVAISKYLVCKNSEREKKKAERVR